MDDNGGFYEFKFEWEEREDEIELFDFESGPSDFSWKQRNSPLDVEDEVQEVWDLTGNRARRTVLVRDHGLLDHRSGHVGFRPRNLKRQQCQKSN